MGAVRISFKNLYEANGMYLKKGGYIDFYKDGEDECYDLRKDCLDENNDYDILLACDGEKFEVIKEYGDSIVLASIEGECILYLTKEEYKIAVIE